MESPNTGVQEDIEEIELALGESKMVTSWIPAWLRLKKVLKKSVKRSHKKASVQWRSDMDRNDYPVITVSGAEWQAAQDAAESARHNLQQLKAEIAALATELVDAYNHQWDEKHLGCIQRMQQLSAVYVICETCFGQGKLRRSDTEVIICTDCNGTGKRTYVR